MKKSRDKLFKQLIKSEESKWRFCKNKNVYVSILEDLEKENDLDTFSLSGNPSMVVVDWLQRHPERIHWSGICSNPTEWAIAEIEKHIQHYGVDSVDWQLLSANPGAHELLQRYSQYVNWNLFIAHCDNIIYLMSNERFMVRTKNKLEFRKHLSQNPHTDVLKLLQSFQDWIDWEGLSMNTNPHAINLIRDKLNGKITKGMGDISWRELSRNEVAIPILMEYTHLIDWEFFSLNTHPRAIFLLRNNPHLIHWTNLSRNPQALDLLSESMDKVNFEFLCENPAILYEVQI
jgi:hypothetical protein